MLNLAEDILPKSVALYIVNLKFSLSPHQFLRPTPTKTPSTAEGKIRSVFNFKGVS